MLLNKKLNSIWQEFNDINQIQEDGYLNIQSEISDIYDPKFFLSCQEDFKQNWKKNKSNYVDDGFLFLKNIYFINGYFFVKNNEIQEYNLFKDVKLSIDSLELPNDLNNLPNLSIIEEECFFCLPTKGHFKNYASWISQILSQINKCLNLEKKLPFFICNLNDWHKNLLNFYFSDLQFIERDFATQRTHNAHLQKNYFFKSLILPISKSPYILTKYDENFLRSKNNYKNLNKRVYLSRLLRKDLSYRCFINEQEIADVLSKYNFEILIPENIPLKELVELLNSCEYVFSAGGAGAWNSVFCKPETKFLSFEIGGWANHHAKLFSHLILDYSIVQGKPLIEEYSHINKNKSQPNFLVDCIKFEDFLNKNFNL